MGIFSEFFGMIRQALKPSENLDPAVQAAWRRAIAFTISALVGTVPLLFLFVVAWTQGWLAFMNLDGSARAGELKAVEARMNNRMNQSDKRLDVIENRVESTNLLIVKGQLGETMIDLCTAINRNNQLALGLASTRMNELEDQYYILEGRAYLRSDCATVLIVNKPH